MDYGEACKHGMLDGLWGRLKLGIGGWIIVKADKHGVGMSIMMEPGKQGIRMSIMVKPANTE